MGKIRKEELARVFANYHVVGLLGTKCKKLPADPFCRVDRIGSFRAYMSGNIQVDHNMQLVCHFFCVTKCLLNTMLDRLIPSRLNIKDVWELCAASGVTWIFAFWLCMPGCKGEQRLNNCEFLGFGGMWLPWCLRCPIAVCQFFLLIALEKTACVGMLTVAVSPLKLLPLGAALLSWKIAPAPFYANFWKNNFFVFCHLSVGSWPYIMWQYCRCTLSDWSCLFA